MTNEEVIANLQKRLAALEAVAPAAPVPGGLGGVIAGAIAELGKPDSAMMGQVRHYLGIGGAILAAHGYYATSSDASMLTGAILAVVACVWSILSKYVATRWLEIAVQSPATTTMPQLAALAAVVSSGPVTEATVQAAAPPGRKEGVTL